MLLPARPLIGIAMAWFALGVAAAAWAPLLPAWWTFGAVAALAAALDAARAWIEAPPQVARTVRGTLALGRPARVRIDLAGNRARTVDIWDHVPEAFEPEALPARLRLTPDTVTRLHYRVRPLARGTHRFGPVRLRVGSPWQLWQRQFDARPDTAPVRVYPDFAAFSRHALQATSARVAQTGMLRRRRRGQGLDFEQLRDWREGDSPRQVDWKATRRFDRLISREYQDERDQRILLLADCGRRMGARDGELSHFDHALDALLLLAYVGLRHGDAVGMMTLGGVQRWVAPHKTRAALSRILNAVFDLEPTLEATDFEQAATALLARERKRALVVLLTNLRDEDDENLLRACRMLGRRHLVMVASLREAALDETCHTTGDAAGPGSLRGAALEYRMRRDAALARLRQAGVLCLDVAPQELAVSTVNRYLAIKAEGRL